MYTMMVLAHLVNLWYVHRKYVHVWEHNMLYSKVHVLHMHESVLLFHNQEENCHDDHTKFCSYIIKWMISHKLVERLTYRC